jgi:hypothetical protein
LQKIAAIKKKVQALDLEQFFFSKVGMFLYISFTSYWEGSHDILSSFVKPPKLVLLEENNDDVEGLSYEIKSSQMIIDDLIIIYGFIVY